MFQEITLSASESDNLQAINSEDEESGGRRRRKKQFRWNDVKDLALVTEAENLKPFLLDDRKSAQIWRNIAAAIGKKFNGTVTYIAAQRRFNSLLSEFKQEDFKNRYKYATAQLCHENNAIW